MSDQDADHKKPWHLDKTVSISHIVATVSAVGAILVFGSKLDTRVSLLEQATATNQREMSDLKHTVRQDLRDISQKLDKLLLQERGK